MIKFITGLPGAGKSLRAVELIVQARKEGRAVYVCGLDGINLELGCEGIDSPNAWEQLPDGSLVVIDEAQKWWPQRRSGDPPAYIRALSEHRHHGFDFIIVTQHPAMVDKYVRTLCGEHEHVLRQFGMSAAKLVTWSECYDDPQSQSTRDRGTAKVWRYPKELFQHYKSATLHTVKARIPFRMKVIPVAALLVVALGVYAFRTVMGMGGPAIDAGVSVGVPANVLAPGAGAPAASKRGPDMFASVDAYVHAQIPRVPGQPWSAPIFDGREPAASPELYCISSETLKCICHTEQGTRYRIDARQCLAIVHGGGTYNPFRAPVQSERSPPGQPSASQVVQAAEYVERPGVRFRDVPRDPPQSTREIREASYGP